MNIENLQFGDKVYAVLSKNNVMVRKRLSMIDNEGNEWFRYDRPAIEYWISEFVYVGKTTFINAGETDPNDHELNKMFFKNEDGELHMEYEEDFMNIKNWFLSKEEAETCIDEMKLFSVP